jgi:hypothetical protein
LLQPARYEKILKENNGRVKETVKNINEKFSVYDLTLMLGKLQDSLKLRDESDLNNQGDFITYKQYMGRKSKLTEGWFNNNKSPTFKTYYYYNVIYPSSLSILKQLCLNIRPLWMKLKNYKEGFLPSTWEELNKLGWDCCDFIIITGDAYVDHSSFGAALIGRVLEAQGYRVGILDQPNWKNDSHDDFKRLGRPKYGWMITAGNIDSMVNHYTG